MAEEGRRRLYPLTLDPRYSQGMTETFPKILSPKGRPSRPVREIRAVVRRVAAQAAKEGAPAPGSIVPQQKKMLKETTRQ